MSESLATLTWGQIGRLLSALFLGMFSLEVESYLATASTAQKFTYMSQMLYAGQSDREIVTFFSDFQQL